MELTLLVFSFDIASASASGCRDHLARFEEEDLLRLCGEDLGGEVVDRNRLERLHLGTAGMSAQTPPG